LCIRALVAFTKFRDGVDRGSYTIILSLRDGSLLLRHSWHFVPGYSHESLRDNKSPAPPEPRLGRSGSIELAEVLALPSASYGTECPMAVV
jgi:hypothetical protein